MLHLSQIFLTLVRTFIAFSLEPVCNTTTGEVVGSQFHLNFVARKNTDVVHPHFSGDMRQYLVAVLEFHAKHSVRQGFKNRALEHDRIFFWLSQGGLLDGWDRMPP